MTIKDYVTDDVSRATMMSESGWGADKADGLGLDFPNLPYLKDTDGTKITETAAVHYYIAEKWNPELLGTTPQERAVVE
jgi:hypothetical protein